MAGKSGRHIRKGSSVDAGALPDRMLKEIATTGYPTNEAETTRKIWELAAEIKAKRLERLQRGEDE